MRASSVRPTGSAVGLAGAVPRLFWGRKPRSFLIVSMPSFSSFAPSCATPDLVVCTDAPPSCSWSTTSPVTDLTTEGPVRNMYEVFSIIRVKSVRAGE